MDFEKYWFKKFSTSVESEVTEEKKKDILDRSDDLSEYSSREEVFKWTENALIKLHKTVDKETQRHIMLRCACHYPESDFDDLKTLYSKTKDIKLIHKKLREKFDQFLFSLNIKKRYKKEILQRKMRLAGNLEDNSIIATKIPKSAYITNWFEEEDKNKKRQIYCHCPRIRDVLINQEKKLPEIYCYCGAGFYQNIWETILQRPVKVEVIESVMNGGNVCKIQIHL